MDKKESLLDKIMTTKWITWWFWTTVVVMVSALIFYTANLGKETPPIPDQVVSVNWEVLYSSGDIAQGKGYFQEFDLMDWGTFLGMWAYIGPDFSTDFFHNRAVFLYNYYGQKNFWLWYKDKTVDKKWNVVSVKSQGLMNPAQVWAIKEIVKADFKHTLLKKDKVVYSEGSALAYKDNVKKLVEELVNWDKSRAYPGGFITEEEAKKIAAYVDWSQLVVSSPRYNKKTWEVLNRTWSNNWPNEPLVDQDLSWNNHVVSLWEFLLLWPFSILVVILGYNFFFKPDDRKDLEKPLKVTKLFQSQKNLIWIVPIIALLIVVQMTLWGYLAHVYVDPSQWFTFPWLENIINIPQSWLPFNAIRSIHTQLAILWIAGSWLVWGLMIVPWVAWKDHKFPWLVHILFAAIVVVVVGSVVGLYMWATWMLPDTWFWLGNEGRELVNLWRVWDFWVVAWLVIWFLMIVSVLKKASVKNPLAATIVWSAFAIAGLYVAWMIPFQKIMPNFTVDDFYRWWVIHLWVELTFELFAVWVISFFTVSLGLVSQKSAVRLMVFELLLVMLSGTLWVGHHYWWQGLDKHWIAIGWIFSALEPVPLVLLIAEAWNNYREKTFGGKEFEFGTVFMWISGSAVLNFIWAGWLGMVINTPTINYYTHGTYLIMPHGHVALLWAFGYIAIAFLYLFVRSYVASKGMQWKTKLANTSFWLLTIWVLLFAIPTLLIWFHQWAVSFNEWYYFTRLHEILAPMTSWMWFRIIPDTMMILGGLGIFFDITSKICKAARMKDLEK